MNLFLKMKSKHFRLWGLAGIFLVLILSVPVLRAQDEGIMNRLFAPGPLTKGHDTLEGPNDCKKCHEAGKGIADSKCLECHKEIRAFVQKKSGFHGLMTESCSKCHMDHKGREFESAAFDIKTFDHKKTGYILAGKHHDLKCEECHKEERGNKRNRPHDLKFVGATKSCRGCHVKDDIHFFKGEFATKDCGACHGLSKWDEDIKFDHKKETKFPLVGVHDELECQACHSPNELNLRESKYKWPTLAKEQCLACHESYHKSNLGPKFQNGKCDACHNQKEWVLPQFDHKVTGYPLRGEHATADCLACHVTDKNKLRPLASGQMKVSVHFADLKNKNIKWTGLTSNCLTCHQDEHRFGQYKSPTKLKAQDCLSCHTESSWKKIHDFSHNASTRYVIDGEHRKLKCAECHLAVSKKPIPPPKPGIYFWSKLNEKTCENCHANPHINKFSKELLNKRCTECHVTEGWQVVKTGKNFDHNKTRFVLDGKHLKATCTQCHVKNKEQVFHWDSKDKGFCIECHQNVHKEQFHTQFSAQSCGECHSSNNWSTRKKFDHDLTAYPLKGAHKDVGCNDCHTRTNELFPLKPPKYMGQFQFPELKTKACLNCHQDVHAGQLGNDCVKCHTEATWKLPQFDHQKQTHYPLLGKHLDLTCVKCHKPKAGQVVREFKKNVAVVQYKPINPQCLTCHKDEHKGHFGTQCAGCHSEQSWKTTKDYHKDFTLSGVHFTLQCTECHSQNRKLAGLSQDCIFCHKKDDVHSGTLPECGKCHYQEFWEDSKFRHSMTTFALKGAHRVLQCQDCHSNGVYQGLSSDCISCHLGTVQAAVAPVSHVPVGNFVNCTQCHHNPFRW